MTKKKEKLKKKRIKKIMKVKKKSLNLMASKRSNTWKHKF